MVEISSRADLIERKVDRAITKDILISREAGGVDIRQLDQVMEAAKLMSVGDSMIPAHLREKPGACFGIIWKALAWGMDPFAVAEMSYEVENKKSGERKVAYMSQLIHAVIESRAPIKHRLKVRYEGEGDDRVCIVSGTFTNEDEPREHKSPRLGDRKPAKRQSRDGEDWSPGSPLWYSKPDVQLYYDTSRDWARIYCPDVLMGIYTKDEMEAVGYSSVPRETPKTPPDDGGFSTRLSQSALARVGFPADQVVAQAAEIVRRGDQTSFDVEATGADSIDADEARDAKADPAATQDPPEEEGRPRASRSRRKAGPPETDEARLV
jgi:hypothetical protein